jgi:ABC-type sugar transport system ATPase subunit
VADVAFTDVRKVFPDGTVALEGLTLAADDGEFLIMVGPSGCGKTTALRILAGLESATSGTVAIGGTAVDGVSPRDRDIAMVFQNYALYPHMTVARNLGFGLRERRVSRGETDRRVREIAAMLGLEDLLRKRPAELSGGQRQRVAMGRALVRRPRAFLLDEPLSNLDAKLRVQMRSELKRLHQEFGVTTVYVTHDQVEAMTLGQRIAVMSAGELQQVGTPAEVYERPANVFVAAFIGTPSMNLLRGACANGHIDAGGLRLARPGLDGRDVIVGIRPECLLPAGSGGGEAATLAMDVEVVEPLGNETLVHGRVDGTAASVDVGEDEGLPPLAGDRAVAVARVDRRFQPRTGERIAFAVDPEAVLLFDARTGEAV